MLAFGYTGKKAITEEGNKGVIGGAKAQEVRNWIKAWQKES